MTRAEDCIGRSQAEFAGHAAVSSGKSGRTGQSVESPLGPQLLTRARHRSSPGQKREKRQPLHSILRSSASRSSLRTFLLLQPVFFLRSTSDQGKRNRGARRLALLLGDKGTRSFHYLRSQARQGQQTGQHGDILLLSAAYFSPLR